MFRLYIRYYWYQIFRSQKYFYSRGFRWINISERPMTTMRDGYSFLFSELKPCFSELRPVDL